MPRQPTQSQICTKVPEMNYDSGKCFHFSFHSFRISFPFTMEQQSIGSTDSFILFVGTLVWFAEFSLVGIQTERDSRYQIH